MVAALPVYGWRPQVLDLGDGFPYPSADVHAAACARLAAQGSKVPIVVDGLAFGVLPEAAAALGASHCLVALVHHPLALESGLSPGERERLAASERTALGYARHVIATSNTTAHMLVADYGVPSAGVSVVAPGTDPPVATAAVVPRQGDDVVTLLAVGAVVPRKGFDVLVAALGELAALPWRLMIAGDLGRSPPTAARLAADIAARGLADRIVLRGAVSDAELAALYAGADLFVLPSRFEGFGMAYAEAIAHGLPVIGTTAGAIPETVPPEAGVLVAPDDVAALAAALKRLIASPVERARLAAGARAARLPSWPQQAQLFARVLAGLA
ncbi:MAG: glycosyltransferase family 1 protein [Proteobacteria bacterium]|nr:MAG: glycosyltransferase family 1 protein [Pseudomonadota bacterium]